MLVIIIIILLIKKFRFKKEYTLPELNTMIKNAHTDLKNANGELIKLQKAFIEIGRTNGI